MERDMSWLGVKWTTNLFLQTLTVRQFKLFLIKVLYFIRFRLLALELDKLLQCSYPYELCKFLFLHFLKK